MLYKRCSKCSASAKEKDANFCSNCGQRFEENHCSNEECENNKINLDKNDCYCFKCGKKTTYFIKGYSQVQTDLPF
ncbi:hypothetical protein MHH85_11145 [Viridibacillus sp. FSL E2-0187]|uniref:hypothetical protein n=1 Tax=Viridibacillus sp. FSL E2-0187 TaxID=2921362 RepID=UPI0030F824F0